LVLQCNQHNKKKIATRLKETKDKEIDIIKSTTTKAISEKLRPLFKKTNNTETPHIKQFTLKKTLL
jgi:hypothetical protein